MILGRAEAGPLLRCGFQQERGEVEVKVRTLDFKSLLAGVGRVPWLAILGKAVAQGQFARVASIFDTKDSLYNTTMIHTQLINSSTFSTYRRASNSFASIYVINSII